MPDFISKLAARVDERRASLAQTLRPDAEADEAILQALMAQHWHPLPDGVTTSVERGPAFAVAGSVRRVNLANGAFLFTAQALLIGEGRTETDVDVEILRGTIPRSSIERFADLFLHRLEIGLARDYAWQIPEGSVVFLDGALYGQLPQLYPLTIEGVEYPFPEDIILAYLELFQTCRDGFRVPISMAKTSREATHTRIWATHEGTETLPLEIPDSEMIYRWTGDRAGYSTPVILGTWGFTRGSRELIEQGTLRDAPAIVSFFVRLADYDDAVRVDVPAFCLNDQRRLGDVKGAVLPPNHPLLHDILRLLASDYGGLEVYNALLYAADREVRLERRTMHEVYLNLIQHELGCEIRLDRSDRRS
jgi:hypothetical protein